MLDQSLRFLGHYKRVLVIGAHPDDEDTELLTVLTRHHGAEAAYLSLNRGEGGQNLIGPELGEALGILRSEELLAARRLDGAQQFFTRAYDFGYAKSLDDTWAHWPRDSVLEDVVRIIRRFRPQVVVSIFSGTPRDGHGQHQAAGWAALEAFRLAGDSTAFQDGGDAPWTPLKLYRTARFDTAGTSLRLDGGVVDPAIGKTYHQLAMESRSLHRSQDMGQLQSIAPSEVRLALLQSRTGTPDTSLWAGIDTTMTSLLGPEPRAAYLAALERVRAASPAGKAGFLATADSVLVVTAGAGQLGVELRDQRARLAAAWQAATGTLFDVRLDAADVVTGGTSRAVCEVRAAAVAAAAPCAVSVRSDARPWQLDSMRTRPGYAIAFGRVGLSDVESSQPYFLRQPRDGSMYRWNSVDPATQGLPFEPRPVTGQAVLAGAARETLPALSRAASYRWNDQSRGEERAPVEIVPAVDVALAPARLAWRLGQGTQHELTVALHNVSRDSVGGRVRLELPRGWPEVPARTLGLAPGERREVVVRVRPPVSVSESRARIRAAFEQAGPGGNVVVYDRTRRVIAYPHIERRGYSVPAEAEVSFMDLALPAVGLVGYVRGAGDEVPEALSVAGFRVEVIPGSALAGNLARFGAIVIGPRAYEVDSALVRHNALLLAYARNGGRVIVQYQQYGFFFGQMGPFPLYVASRPPGTGAAPTVTSTPASSGTIGAALLGGHDRVTDESAVVRVVDPASPVLTRPNRIGPRDWDGWVQERGLYFARAWAPEFHAVVAMNDPGEASLEGGLLVARVGKGSYIYTGLSFFRQLPAGVPGAFRLFANLLAVGGTR